MTGEKDDKPLFTDSVFSVCELIKAEKAGIDYL